MGTVKGMNTTGYCDNVYQELACIKDQVVAMKVTARDSYGAESELYRIHDRHLSELADYIDWKLQLLTKACPFEWKAMDRDVEDVVSVSESETLKGPDFSGGYLGG